MTDTDRDIRSPEFYEALACRRKRVDSHAEGQHIQRLLKLDADIADIERLIYMSERSDNFYHTSGRARTDRKELTRVKALRDFAQTEFAANEG